jgi:hypothetical protein
MPLKRPVTLAQARRWPAAAKRRESFCARMGGMRELLTGERAARDPGSPINRALAAWDCDKPEGLKREHVSKGIRMKITKAKVGAESKGARRRKNPETVRKIGKFNVRYLPGGRDSKIEFYDSRYTDGRFGELGQFVTRYFARDILESPMGPLALDLGIPEWSITAAEKEKVRELIARSGDFGPVLNPAKPKRRPGVVRMVNEEIDRMTAKKVYGIHEVGMRTPIAVFANRADAVEFGQHWANVHKMPVQVIEQ